MTGFGIASLVLWLVALGLGVLSSAWRVLWMLSLSCWLSGASAGFGIAWAATW